MPRGLVLVTGPTGSGKTTTLATMIDWINQNLDRHIITIEDPIEYYHSHKPRASSPSARSAADVPDFPEAMRRVLRQDPDVILLGEMRDLETISAAITAAETGHLVFGTLHTTGQRAHRQPDHRRLPGEPAGADPGAALGRSLGRVISQAALDAAQGRRGAHRGLRGDADDNAAIGT